MPEKNIETIIDFITGKQIPDTGSEANRQSVEKFLINEKGFSKEDVEVDAPLEFKIGTELYKSKIDLVICLQGKRFMAIKCAPGSLGSREKEIVSGSRLLDTYQIPFCAVSDGKTAIVLDTVTGKKTGQGMDAIPSKQEAEEKFTGLPLFPLPTERIEKEKLIFRTYDSMNINRHMP